MSASSSSANDEPMTYSKEEVERIFKKEVKIDTTLKELCKTAEDLNDDIHEELYKKLFCLQTWFAARKKEKSTGKIRIASWNVQDAAIDDRHIGMRGTIGKDHFDIVALQEAGSEGATAKRICSLLGPNWKSNASESLSEHFAGAFLWNGSKLKREKFFDLRMPGDFKYTPTLGIFSNDDDHWKFALLNFHLQPRTNMQKIANDKEMDRLGDALTQAKRKCETYRVPPEHIILLGDFNIIPQNDELDEQGYVNIFGRGQYTNAAGNDTYDNIIVSYKLKHRCELSGISDTATYTKKTIENEDGFINIPANASDHRAIWADFHY